MIQKGNTYIKQVGNVSAAYVGQRLVYVKDVIYYKFLYNRNFAKMTLNIPKFPLAACQVNFLVNIKEDSIFEFIKSFSACSFFSNLDSAFRGVDLGATYLDESGAAGPCICAGQDYTYGTNLYNTTISRLQFRHDTKRLYQYSYPQYISRYNTFVDTVKSKLYSKENQVSTVNTSLFGGRRGSFSGGIGLFVLNTKFQNCRYYPVMLTADRSSNMCADQAAHNAGEIGFLDNFNIFHPAPNNTDFYVSNDL